MYRDIWNALFKKKNDWKPKPVHIEREQLGYSLVFPLCEADETLLSIHKVPTDCLMVIFSYLSANSLARASQVCKLWCKVASHESLWQSFFPKGFKPPKDVMPQKKREQAKPLIPSCPNWKRAFIEYQKELLRYPNVNACTRHNKQHFPAHTHVGN